LKQKRIWSIPRPLEREGKIKLYLGKFSIRWCGPYGIKEIYYNNTVDVNTLQEESLRRVNMSKIKPHHEP
jgi:hypothetical protein